ncbi:MAG: hypothetical protein SCM11_00980 [Bacillota bacterium]|nr:hypothetical protein [Bacillota bacterium]
MKTRILFSVTALFIVVLLLSSCMENKPTEQSTEPSSTTTTAGTTNSELIVLERRLVELELANSTFAEENRALTRQVQQLNDSLSAIQNLLVQPGYYQTDELLQRIFWEESTVVMFPAELKSLIVETVASDTFFVFTVDRMEYNPDWDGPSTDGRGFIENKEVSYEEIKGDLFINFNGEAFATPEDKTAGVLEWYIAGDIYTFYLVGDAVVMVQPLAGP